MLVKKKTKLIFILLMVIFFQIPVSTYATSCEDHYHDKNIVRARGRLKKRACRFCLGFTGLGLTTAATVVSFGSASQIAILSSSYSIALMTGGLMYEGSSVLSELDQMNINSKAVQLIRSAKFYLMGQPSKDFDFFYKTYFSDHFYQAHTRKNRNCSLFSNWFSTKEIYPRIKDESKKRDIAEKILNLNEEGLACLLIRDQVNRVTYFRFFTEQEILLKLRSHNGRDYSVN